MKQILSILLPAAFLWFSSLLLGQDVTSTVQMERQIFEWTNEERAKIDVPPLTWNDRLALAARMHSSEMAKQKELSHQLKGEPVFTERLSERGARFTAAAENVGFGDDEETLHGGWMHSPGHRANILNPSYTEMGIGIARVGNRLWATEDFVTALQNLSSEEFEQAVGRQIGTLRKSHGMAAFKIAPSPELRRLACSGETSAGAGLAALGRRNVQAFSFSFSGPTPDDLPGSLVKKVLEMPAGGYLIGSCSRRGNQGMMTYRTLIVLHG